MKVLIVDDSIVFRSSISQALQGATGIEVVKAVSNGKLAIDFLKQNSSIDLITLDMEMPVMDGMETIKEIRKFNREVTIIVFSSQTVRGAEKTIDALSAGADDFVTKTEGVGTIDESIEMIKQELLPRLKAFAGRHIKRSEIEKKVQSTVVEKSNKLFVYLEEMPIKPRLVCIGSSTGGPEALSTVFKGITDKMTVPMLIVQHMPPVFTAKLAEMLNKLSPVEVREAKDGDVLTPNVCLIAPGDYHMTITKQGVIKLNQSEKVCFVRPSVDVLFNSVAESFEQQVLAFVMTGMGDDGANGCKKMKNKNPYIYIQDKDSCIVWGMPGAVSRADVGAKVVELNQIATIINSIAKRP